MMARVITYGGNTKIGAYMFPDRKKPCICVQKGNQITLYGTFNDIEAANNFMNELADFLIFCYGLHEDMSDWKIREECKKCDAYVDNAEPLKAGEQE